MKKPGIKNIDNKSKKKISSKRLYLGIDVGSVSMKGVIIDDASKIIKSYYTKNHGLIETTKEVISHLKTDGVIEGVGVTGSGREFISALIGGDIIESEVISHFVATTTLYPDVKTIFDIGGEDCKLMIVENGKLVSFQMNRDCGGGTGAMIESIAHRMGIRLDDIAKTALKSKAHVIIPSKCGIFAQSAVVSKINKGIPKEDILMGVCRGLVGNFFTMLAKGARLRSPYVFQGATANNAALVKCFEEELKEKVIVPNEPELMGAYGIAILVKEQKDNEKNDRSMKKLKSNFRGFDKIKANFDTRISYGANCSNRCEITEIYKDGKKISTLGNRCERCA